MEAKPCGRVACIWLPNWPIQRLAAARTERKEPAGDIVLYEARPQGGLKVVACSKSADIAGVRRQMPLAEAIALLEAAGTTGSSLVVEPHDPIADRQQLEALAHLCQQFSPIVSVEDAPLPDSLLLDITGMAHLFKGEANLQTRLQETFARHRLSIRLAIADTVGAAWAFAHFGTARQQADGLAALPIAALRLDAETLDRLQQLGIERIEQLWQLPREMLASRFGPELLLRLDQATGLVAEPVAAHKTLQEFSAEWLLEHPTDHQETIDFVFQSLTARLTEQLVARREGVLRCDVRCDLQDREALRFSVGLYRPTASAKHLFDLLQLQLEKIRLPARVEGICLTVSATGPLETEQQSLFTEHAEPSPHHRAALVDRLTSRLGCGAVLQARLLADAQPEYACQLLPLTGAGVQRQAKAASRQRRIAATPENACLLRPLRLSKPVPIEVVMSMADGPPMRFRVSGSEQRLVNAWGPERIETGWWRKAGMRRDYYRVETHTGQQFWLFRRLPDRRWFLHGIFE